MAPRSAGAMLQVWQVVLLVVVCLGGMPCLAEVVQLDDGGVFTHALSIRIIQRRWLTLTFRVWRRCGGVTRYRTECRCIQRDRSASQN